VRLDLFLKTSRLVKRRSLSRELCDAGRVLVNDHKAKPAKKVKGGDRITLKFSTRVIELDILEMPLSLKKALPDDLYKIRSETRLPKEKDLWIKNHS
jgi:ribosomal 50S subunit-recycling heat shock protein